MMVLRRRLLLLLRRRLSKVRRASAVRVSAQQVRVAPRHASLRVGVHVTPGWRLPGVVLLHVDRRKREGDDTRPPRHVGLAQLPVHRFSGAPWDLHLLCHFGPHFRLEPANVQGRTSQ